MHVDTIREAIRRQPFLPFTLQMNDGRRFHVLHPDYVAVSRREVYIIDPTTDAGMFVEPVLIASLVHEPRSAQPSAETKNG